MTYWRLLGSRKRSRVPSPGTVLNYVPNRRLVRLSEAQNHRCAYCGCVMALNNGDRRSATIDHVIPLSRGGRRNLANEVAACWRCNNSRGDTEAHVYFAARIQVPLNAVEIEMPLMSEPGVQGPGLTDAAEQLRRRVAKAEARAKRKGRAPWILRPELLDQTAWPPSRKRRLTVSREQGSLVSNGSDAAMTRTAGTADFGTPKPIPK